MKVLRFLLALLTSFVVTVILLKVLKSIPSYEFLTGWFSCMVFYQFYVYKFTSHTHK